MVSSRSNGAAMLLLGKPLDDVEGSGRLSARIIGAGQNNMHC